MFQTARFDHVIGSTAISDTGLNTGFNTGFTLTISPAMSLRIIQVDAFTDRPFSGNPAAVCILPGPREEEWMQAVAREMNLSETAFLLAREDRGFNLRWFTPTTEVDLCGHATLASVHILWEDEYLASTEVARFHTLSGTLTAIRSGEWITMDFPAKPDEETLPPADLEAALGIEPVYVGRSHFDLIVELESESEVRELEPDLGRTRNIPARGVIVTSRADSGEFDFVSRFFAPRVGVDEDPVTGSAHACLGPYWQKRLGRNSLTAYQASPRGGVLRVEVRGDRVGIGGQAVTIMRAELLY